MRVKIFKEGMSENFQVLVKSYLQIQELEEAAISINSKKSTLKYIIVKLLTVQDTEKFLKATRDK